MRRLSRMLTAVTSLVIMCIGFEVAGFQMTCEACSVPVFRYALEKWSPDPYEVLLFHRGMLTDAQASLLNRLTAETADGRPIANLKVTLVDLDLDPSAEHLSIWEAHADTTPPLLVVQTPSRSGPKVTVWVGELSEPNVQMLVDSPIRQELANRILKGDSVVWVLLESGDPEVDEQAFATLTTELDRLQQTLTLPELAAEDVQELGIESGSLKLAFSALRLSRDDPADRLLVDMLLRIEPDLLDAEFAEMPMAFPIFGRGRVLHALVGAGISPALIEDSSRFLTGACQCTVKAENPGVDLLMSVDWDGLVQPTMEKDTELPPLAGLTGFVAAASGDDANESDSTSEGANNRDTSADDHSPSVASASVDALAPTDEVPHTADSAATAERTVSPEATSGSSVVRNAMLVVLALGLVVIVATSILGRQSA